MKDERVEKAFNLLKQACTLLEEVAFDKAEADPCVRNVCLICGSMVRNVASSLANIV